MPEPKEDNTQDQQGQNLPAERLESSLQETPASEVQLVEAQRVSDLSMDDPAGGLLSKLRHGHLRTRKELEAVEIVLDAQLAKLRHQGEAVERESKAYWDAKSVEVASSIKTYVQARLRAMENERMESRMSSLQEAYEMYAAKSEEVLQGSLPESMKESLLQRLGQTLETSLKRIETDAIAGQHDLLD